MASDSPRHPDDGTVLLDSDERAALHDQWPVDDRYLVEPPARNPDDTPSGDETIVVGPSSPAPPPNRRLREVGTAVVAITAAVALAALTLAGVLYTSDDAQPARGASKGTTPSAKASTRVAETKSRVTTTTAPAATTSHDTTMSEETPAVAVPSLVGLSASKAAAALREAGFVPRIRLVATKNSRAGLVLTQSPRSASKAERGSTVQLDVSRASSPPPRVEVPDLVGLDAAEARQELGAMKLGVTVVHVVSSQPSGTVVRQSPRSGSRVSQHARVTLTVSSGPNELYVPDVTDLDEQSARAELEGAGFEVTVTYESTADPAEDGRVIGQTPTGGTSAADGSVVTIVVARNG